MFGNVRKENVLKQCRLHCQPATGGLCRVSQLEAALKEDRGRNDHCLTLKTVVLPSSSCDEAMRSRKWVALWLGVSCGPRWHTPAAHSLLELL